MHPNRMEIRQLLEGVITDERRTTVLTAHLKDCSFCSEIVEEERMILRKLEETSDEEITPELQALAKQLYQQSLLGVVVDLTPLDASSKAPDLRIAADGADGSVPKAPRIENLLTLFSENPEFVLNVMRDNSTQKDYLQLSSDEQSNVSRVLVRIPQLNTELMTNTHGHVDLPEQLKTDASELNVSQINVAKSKWQVRLPSAVFDLDPIIYDPEKVEFSKDVELETDRHDKIQVTFQRKTEGAQVSIRILELEGRKDFQRVKIVLSQNESHSQVIAESDNPVTFDINDQDSSIHLRLFS